MTLVKHSGKKKAEVEHKLETQRVEQQHARAGWLCRICIAFFQQSGTVKNLIDDEATQGELELKQKYCIDNDAYVYVLVSMENLRSTYNELQINDLLTFQRESIYVAFLYFHSNGEILIISIHFNSSLYFFLSYNASHRHMLIHDNFRNFDMKK